MLKMQTVFAECPAKSKLKYLLRISLQDWSSEDYLVLLQQPGNEAVESQVDDDSITVERIDGPGVWRFNAIVRSRKNIDDVVDVLTVEAVIFPEAYAPARAALESSIAAMNLVITGDGTVAQGNWDVTEDAAKLYSEYSDRLTLEILRRLAMNRSNQNDILRCLRLLEFTLNRSSVKWLTPFALPVLCEVASTTTRSMSTSAAQKLIKEMLVSPNEKWIYLLRLAIEAPSGGLGLEQIIYELERCTPSDYRMQTAVMILELCDSRISSRRAAANLFKLFEYSECAPTVMDWLQTNTIDLGTACNIFQMASYRESIPFLRKIIAKPGQNSDDVQVMLLLAEWQDIDSIPLLLSKLEVIDQYSAERITIQLLASFGSTVFPQIKEFQSRCSLEKAKRIGQILENTYVK
jgi:hypothetical protein